MAAPAPPAASNITSTSATVPASTAATPREAASPKAGGTLRYGIAAEIVTLGFNQSNDFEVLQGMYDPLLTYDDTLQPVPHLAESWEQSSDLKQIKLNLRKGVMFHNGREFTSDDVEYNVQRAMDPTRARRFNWSVWPRSGPSKLPTSTPPSSKSEQPRSSVFDLLTQMRIGDKETLEGPERQEQARTEPVRSRSWTGRPGRSREVREEPELLAQSGLPYLDGYEVSFTQTPRR